MNIKNIVKKDWFKRLIGRGKGNRQSESYGKDPFKEFESMQDELSKLFDRFYILSPNLAKEVVSGYHIPEHDKLHQGGPTVYGYTMTVGLDGRPQVMEFGNANSFAGDEMEKEKSGRSVLFGDDWFESFSTPQEATSEREPMVDVSSTDKEVKVVSEILGLKEEDIAINANDGKLEVLTNAPQRNYRKLIELPQDADPETAKFTYNNGILEVTLKKKKNVKPRGKEIIVE